MKVGKIALLPLSGTVSSDEGGFKSPAPRVNSYRVLHALQEAEKKRSIKAVLLAINSPGGAVYPCTEIAKAITAFPKPTVAWVREYAASGGYMIAASCDHIVAAESSILGSIGAVSLRPDASSLLEKLGVTVDTVSSTPDKQFGLPLGPQTPEERNWREGMVNDIYAMFVAYVRSCRPSMTEEQLEKSASGRAFLGKEALELNLIDEIGRYVEALMGAAILAGVTHPVVVDWSKKIRKAGLLALLGR